MMAATVAAWLLTLLHIYLTVFHLYLPTIGISRHEGFLMKAFSLGIPHRMALV